MVCKYCHKETDTPENFHRQCEIAENFNIEADKALKEGYKLFSDKLEELKQKAINDYVDMGYDRDKVEDLFKEKATENLLKKVRSRLTNVSYAYSVMDLPKINISFCKTNSPNYNTAYNFFSKFEGFTTDGKVHSFSIDVRDLHGEAWSHIQDIDRWKSTKIYIGEKQTRLFHLESLLELVKCFEEYGTTHNQTTYCFTDPSKGYEGWGCKHLKTIHRHLPEYSDHLTYRPTKYWFEYGAFENGVWVVSKERILARLKYDVQEKHIDFCPLFSMEALEEKVNKLPDQINPETDKNWEYEKKIVSDGFSKTGIVIGVIPKLNKFNYNREILEEVAKRLSESSGVSFEEINPFIGTWQGEHIKYKFTGDYAECYNTTHNVMQFSGIYVYDGEYISIMTNFRMEALKDYNLHPQPLKDRYVLMGNTLTIGRVELKKV